MFNVIFLGPIAFERRVAARRLTEGASRRYAPRGFLRICRRDNRLATCSRAPSKGR